MSTVIRPSRRIVLPALIVVGLLGTLVGVKLFGQTVNRRPWVAPIPNVADESVTVEWTSPTFIMGPVAGLTTRWHAAVYSATSS